MLTADVDAETADELRRQYAAALAVVVDDVGEDRVREDAGLDPATIDEIRDAVTGDDRDGATTDDRDGIPDDDANRDGTNGEGESGADAVALADAAAVFALDDGRSADDVLAEVRDVLLLGMSSAVLDVESIAADLDGLDPGEIQAKVEGRHPMTLGEYARLRHYVEHS